MHFKRYSTYFYTVIFAFLTILIILYPAFSLSYAALGLSLWYDKMVPSLFPFMILSGMMIRMNLTENFISLLYPLIKPFFQISKNVCYCIFIGFLCGFPMGAKTVSDMYVNKKISKAEAEYLLCFVNNIGPVYFTGYVLPLLGKKNIIPYAAGMYLLPFLYGLILRYTFFRRSLSDMPIRKKRGRTTIRAASISSYSESSVFCAIDASIQSAVTSILSLGGYMIFFNTLNLLPRVFFGRSSAILSPLFEINGGLYFAADCYPLYILLLLPFGGCSCIAQTYSCIRNTDLKISNYILHKIILTLLTACYYLAWKLLFPETFLT